MTDPILTMDTVVKQNTGLDPGLRAWGGIDGWNWMTKGWPATGQKTAPGGFTAMTGYHHQYMERDKPFVDTGVFLKSFTSWVHKKGGGWLKVQELGPLTVTHGYWKGDFSVTRGGPAPVRIPGPPVEDRVQCPRGGDIEHGWPSARGSYPVNTVDGVFCCFLARIDVANACVLMGAGVDWWLDGGAPFKPDHSTNPACSVNSWTKLTTEWQWITTTDSLESQLAADPPPPLVLDGVEPGPEPEPEPVGPQVVIEINGQPMKATDTVTFKMVGGPEPAPVDLEQYRRPEQME